MTERFVRMKGKDGYQDIFSESYEKLNFLAFGKLDLKSGKSYKGQTGEYEHVLVIISGEATVTAGEKKWEALGGRKNVFEGKATSIYIPINENYEVTADTDVVIAVCKAKAEKRYDPFVIKPDEVVTHHRGEKQWKRNVHDIIADNANGRVDRIIVGETINLPGQWSGYPPHKHDGEHYPEEPNLEEIYYYQVNPEQGFGVQLHYTKDRTIDDAYTFRPGDSFAIDKGYHPVVSAGGYEVYYLWFMAGDTGRELRPYEDSDHKWVNH